MGLLYKGFECFHPSLGPCKHTFKTKEIKKFIYYLW